MIREFFADARTYSLRVAVYNFRFNLAWAIMPGTVKRMAVLDDDPEAGTDQWRGEGGDDLGDFAAAHVRP